MSGKVTTPVASRYDRPIPPKSRSIALKALAAIKQQMELTNADTLHHRFVQDDVEYRVASVHGQDFISIDTPPGVREERISLPGEGIRLPLYIPFDRPEDDDDFNFTDFYFESKVIIAPGSVPGREANTSTGFFGAGEGFRDDFGIANTAAFNAYARYLPPRILKWKDGTKPFINWPDEFGILDYCVFLPINSGSGPNLDRQFYPNFIHSLDQEGFFKIARENGYSDLQSLPYDLANFYTNPPPATDSFRYTAFFNHSVGLGVEEIIQGRAARELPEGAPGETDYNYVILDLSGEAANFGGELSEYFEKIVQSNFDHSASPDQWVNAGLDKVYMHSSHVQYWTPGGTEPEVATVGGSADAGKFPNSYYIDSLGEATSTEGSGPYFWVSAGEIDSTIATLANQFKLDLIDQIDQILINKTGYSFRAEISAVIYDT